MSSRTAGPEQAAADRRAISSVLLAVLFYSTAYVAGKYVLKEILPFTAAAARFVLSSVGLLVILLIQHRGRLPRFQRGDVRDLVLAGLFGTTLYFAFQYQGLALTTATHTAVIANSRPIWVAILATIFLRERLTWSRAAGVLLAFAGVLLLVTNGDLKALAVGSSGAFGDLLILLNSICGAIGMIFSKRALRHLSPLTTTAYSIIFGTIGLLPLAAQEIAVHGLPQAGLATWGVVLWMATFNAPIPHFLLYVGLATMDATRAAVFMFFVPVLSVIFSFFVLGEPVGAVFVFGSVLVLLGAALSGRSSSSA